MSTLSSNSTSPFCFAVKRRLVSGPRKWHLLETQELGNSFIRISKSLTLTTEKRESRLVLTAFSCTLIVCVTIIWLVNIFDFGVWRICSHKAHPFSIYGHAYYIWNLSLALSLPLLPAWKYPIRRWGLLSQCGELIVTYSLYLHNDPHTYVHIRHFASALIFFSSLQRRKANKVKKKIVHRWFVSCAFLQKFLWCAEVNNSLKGYLKTWIEVWTLF